MLNTKEMNDINDKSEELDMMTLGVLKEILSEDGKCQESKTATAVAVAFGLLKLHQAAIGMLNDAHDEVTKLTVDKEISDAIDDSITKGNK